ncbi:MAG TPA: BNR-4 repeat-containing protein [Polyangiaceae bacterium]|nr:BNR-4 repeat-containing protein [Polyangiaceae bacterium]
MLAIASLGGALSGCGEVGEVGDDASVSQGEVTEAIVGPLSLDNTTDTSVTVDPDAHFLNYAPPLTHGAWQYFVYWDAESPAQGSPAVLKVTRRKLADNTMQSTNMAAPFHLTDPDDGHNSVRSGLSPSDGRIHASWSRHNDPHEYVVSSAGCLSQANLSSCTWTHTTSGQADPVHEGSRVTYPFYFSDRDGNLYMSYRYGSSVNGDQYLNKYNNDGSWSAIGRIIHGRNDDSNPPVGDATPDLPGTFDPDGAGPIAESETRGPYMWGLKFDRNNRLHMMWNWRDALATWGGVPAQRGGNYAYSVDGGVTWKNNAGTTVGTAGTLPLRTTTVGLEVVSLPYTSNFIAYEKTMALDSHNNPHAVFPMSDALVDEMIDASTRQRHVWRTTDGIWHGSWVDPVGERTAGYGSLMFDRADIAYYIYNENKLGWQPWNTSSSTQDQLRFDRFTWQEGEYLNIAQQSDITSLVTDLHVNTDISTTGTNRVRIRMKNMTEGTTAVLWWITDADRVWTLSKRVTFPVTANDTSYKTYVVPITSAAWTGKLRALEFGPIDGTSAEAGDVISIDYIRLTDAAGTIAKAWEFQAGAQVVAAESSPTGNWASWTLNTLLPGLSDTWGDAIFPMDDQRYADGTGDGKKVSFTVTQQGAPGTEILSVHDFDILGDAIMKFWNFDVDTQGWITNGDISGFGWFSDSGARAIGGTITGTESRIYSLNNLKVKIEGNVFHVRLKNTSAATTARLWFITDADGTFNTTKSKTFAITPNSGYTEYLVDMTGVSGWSGTLRRVRLDPSEDAGVTSGSFMLSRLYLGPT